MQKEAQNAFLGGSSKHSSQQFGGGTHSQASKTDSNALYNNDSVVTGKGRRTFSTPAKQTLTSSIKHKYIVRSRHTALCGEKFVPVNKSQAKCDVLKKPVHDDGEPIPDETF